MTPIETTHKGETIYYSETREEWCSKKWEYSNKSLQKVRDHIDRKQKQEAGEFKRITALYSSYGSFPELCEVTSDNGDGTVWISRDGKRSKEPKSKIFKVPYNFPLKASEYKTLEDQATAMQKHISAFTKDFIATLTPEGFR